MHYNEVFHKYNDRNRSLIVSSNNIWHYSFDIMQIKGKDVQEDSDIWNVLPRDSLISLDRFGTLISLYLNDGLFENSPMRYESKGSPHLFFGVCNLIIASFASYDHNKTLCILALIGKTKKIRIFISYIIKFDKIDKYLKEKNNLYFFIDKSRLNDIYFV